jgi:hypothetical protein
MNYLVIITADTNDADFVKEVHRNMSKEEVNRLIKLSSVVLDHGGHNWGTGKYMDDSDRPEVMYEGILTDNEIEFLNEHFPWGEYGIHTVYSVEIYEAELRSKIEVR